MDGFVVIRALNAAVKPWATGQDEEPHSSWGETLEARVKAPREVVPLPERKGVIMPKKRRQG